LAASSSNSQPSCPVAESSIPSKTWESPEWFRPLEVLDGYVRGDHSRAAATLVAACETAHVDPAKVVQSFCLYYPEGRFAHGWINPVSAIVRTRAVQIAKVNGSRNGSNGHYRPSRIPNYRLNPVTNESSRGWADIAMKFDADGNPIPYIPEP